jgi:hypothetical protein
MASIGESPVLQECRDPTPRVHPRLACLRREKAAGQVFSPSPALESRSSASASRATQSRICPSLRGPYSRRTPLRRGGAGRTARRGRRRRRPLPPSGRATRSARRGDCAARPARAGRSPCPRSRRDRRSDCYMVGVDASASCARRSFAPKLLGSDLFVGSPRAIAFGLCQRYVRRGSERARHLHVGGG